MNSALVLDARETGQFPISIATSLAFEGLFGILEFEADDYRRHLHLDYKLGGTPPIKDFDTIWINVRTLFRNMVGAVKNETSSQLSAIDYAMGIIEEITIIQALLDDRTQGRVRATFYAATFNTLSRRYPKAHFKELKTDKQRFYAALENATIEACLRRAPVDTIKTIDVAIKLPHQSTLILTHLPLDLLEATGARDLALIESHTGVVKRKHRWNTKLANAKELTRIPFDRMTIQVFGDGGGIFAPYPREFKQTLLELAEKNQWHSMTTEDRVVQCVKNAREPILEATVTQLYGRH